MIIWGSRGRTFTKNRGSFFCPACSGEQSYKHKLVDKWFTLYFLPLFPTEKLGEYVECNACKSTFNLEVIDYNPEEGANNFHAEFAIAALNIMCKIALGDDSVDSSEIDEIIAIYQSITGIDLHTEEIAKSIDVVRSENINISEYASQICGSLNEQGKEIIIRAASRMCKADGNIDAEEVVLIHELVDGLDLSKSLANRLLREEGIPTI